MVRPGKSVPRPHFSLQMRRSDHRYRR